jgi:hypothetical protein
VKPAAAVAFFAFALLVAAESHAAGRPQLVSPDSSRVRVGGFVETQMRALSDGFSTHRGYLSQWAMILNLEPEIDIAPDGWGPFDSLSAFGRIEARYECVWTGCGSTTWQHFGNRATRAPARNWADAKSERWVGGTNLEAVGVGQQDVHTNSLKLLNISYTPRFDRFYEIGIPRSTVETALGPLLDDRFSYKSIAGPREGLALPLGPWNTSSTIEANGALAGLPSTTLPLPLRPTTGDLFTPTAALRRKLDDFDSFDQNFRQSDLEWNHGGSQDEYELKEAYLDAELFDGRLWLRLGKQNVVWGKTELFRTTDQMNPVDIGLASLPSLEESRVALWSARATWSAYRVGPLEDLRLEIAVNLDDFEPIDTGRCGEPYTVWLICAKSAALWAHGALGTGIAGEVKPPDPWDDVSGLEFGLRVEFRWRRFSVAITDFYGYDDIPSIELFNSFERSVDPTTGRPLGVGGVPLTPGNALAAATANRQGFDFGCVASHGFGQAALLALTGGAGTVPDISDRCIGDVVNLRDPIELTTTLFGPPISLTGEVPNVIGGILAGQLAGDLIMEGALNGLDAALLALLSPAGLPSRLVPLNVDVADGAPGGGLLGTDCSALVPGPLFFLCPTLETGNVSLYLSDEQEALLGCGPFYGTDCDVDGIDFFHIEASVLLQSVPGLDGNPVATRFVNGRLVTLPGARRTDDPDYLASIDGTPPVGFDSEMAAVSFNAMQAIAVLGIAEGDTGCDLMDVSTCAAVRAIVALTGSQRPERHAGGNGRYGRRDFTWHGGGEALIRYERRNVFGFSFDFSEDRTKTSWSAEFTWIEDSSFASNTSDDLLQKADVLNLTISADRPTFVNFLNQNRTFFINSQVFFRYIPDHDESFDTNGPLSALATLAIATGYFQDRLLPALVLVHDFWSASGGGIFQASYRFSETATVTLGMLVFYGKPESNRIPRNPIAMFDTQTEFDIGTRYEGLSAISERDEVFLTLRYTF